MELMPGGLGIPSVSVPIACVDGDTFSARGTMFGSHASLSDFTRERCQRRGALFPSAKVSGYGFAVDGVNELAAMAVTKISPALMPHR